MMTSINMIVLATASGFGIMIIVLLLIFLIIILQLFQKKNIFKALAIINTLIMPKLYKKEITKLKHYEKIILGYRYWVTKNSL